MENTIRLIWQCPSCEDVIVSYSASRSGLVTCDCGKNGVDLFSDHGSFGVKGEIKEISKKKFVNGRWEKT